MASRYVKDEGKDGWHKSWRETVRNQDLMCQPNVLSFTLLRLALMKISSGQPFLFSFWFFLSKRKRKRKMKKMTVGQKKFLCPVAKGKNQSSEVNNLCPTSFSSSFSLFSFQKEKEKRKEEKEMLGQRYSLDDNRFLLVRSSNRGFAVYSPQGEGHDFLL